jgi:aspartokinase
MQSQTTFETARGISGVEVIPGFAAIEVAGPQFDLLEAFRALKRAEVSADFLKLNLEGLSFVVPQELADRTVDSLCAKGLSARAMGGRSVIKVMAPNIRDESGLVARIAEKLVEAGARIEHVGDMNSAVMVVVEDRLADAAADALRECIGKVDLL